MDASETRILIVEDDALLRKSVARFIGQRGYTVFEAENGYAALKIFKKEEPALVITDIRMPVMDGLTLLEELTAESPRTPVIIFSGALTEADVNEAMKMGAWDFIGKPIKKVDYMMDKIEKALVQAQKGFSPLLRQMDTDQEKNTPFELELRKRKKLEKQIAHAKMEWERTADAIAEPIALMDANHFLTRVNRSMAQLFNKMPKDIVGTKKYLSTNGFDNQEQAEKDFAALKGGERVQGKFKDTKLGVTYEVNLHPYYDRDEITVIGCVYIARDISGD